MKKLTLPESISNFLLTKLKTHDLSRKELSSKIDLSYNSIRNLEQGNKQNPSIDTILKIADYFESPIENILDNKNSPLGNYNNINFNEAIENLKSFIKSRLDADNIRGQNIAKIIGIGADTINDFVHPNPRKKSLGCSTLLKLSKFWNVSIDEMIGRVTPSKGISAEKTTPDPVVKKVILSKEAASKVQDIKTKIRSNISLISPNKLPKKSKSFVDQVLKDRDNKSNKLER